MSLLHFVLFFSAVLVVTVLCQETREDSGRFMQMCPAPCGLPLFTLGGTEYYIHTSSKVTWFEAYKICKANDMALLSIETETKSKMIKRAIASFNSNYRYWTSGNDLDNEGRWNWRSTQMPFTFTDWDLGQPGKPLAELENCVYISNESRKDVLKWHDAPCMNQCYFVCEKSNKYSKYNIIKY